MVTKQRLLYRLEVFWTLKDTLNTSEGFWFVACLVLETLGWVLFDSPPPSVLGVGTKTLRARRVKEDNISQFGDNDEPFPEQQHMHGSCYISLFKFKSFHQLNTPKLPQILDIYSVVAL